MTAKEQLLQELPKIPEELATEVLAFLTTLKYREINKSPMLRPTGLCAGEFIIPDDFDAPLPENIMQAFENPA